MADRYLKRTYLIIELTAPAEYNALSDANKDRYKTIISAGIIDFRDGSLAKTALWAMFSEASATRANLEILKPSEPVE